ncbi:hypothetical protein KEJ36_04240 [Candidatus Bathyarchaeota archaeon]|nr:hypothetical protein [Candidatus Bathyarchaeota archaeon]MBS7628002.1 hypothetical protein [Candidatus Bathyarchaeota archaeon]
MHEKPIILQRDHGIPSLQALGFEGKHKKEPSERKRIEGWFGTMKARTRRFYATKTSQ